MTRTVCSVLSLFSNGFCIVEDNITRSRFEFSSIQLRLLHQCVSVYGLLGLLHQCVSVYGLLGLLHQCVSVCDLLGLSAAAQVLIV